LFFDDDIFTGDGLVVFCGSSSTTTSRWVVQMKADGRNNYLGSFDDEQEAARTYDAHAVNNSKHDSWCHI
jgi:hypothetical protein